MYDRSYDNQTLTFEASGGLINSSLVMQDRETNSYWSIMRGQSLKGEHNGTALKEIALNDKTTWRKWREKHPTTLVLSVNGIEDRPQTYRGYFRSDEGFRGAQATDRRMATKESIFAFRLKHQSYAVKHRRLVGGQQFDVAGEIVYLHRNNHDRMQDSTKAFIGDPSHCRYDPQTEAFVRNSNDAVDCPIPLTGFDTFWYNWSLNNPETRVLK